MIEAALLGAGSRGMIAYASYALTKRNEIRFIAVAEPNEERRRLFAELHNIPPEGQFASWHELLEQPKLCETLLICTQDQDHYAPTMKALEKGYHILLEKPMSPDPLESLRMAEEAEKRGRILTVCHTMRYSTYWQELKRIVDSGAIGRIMTVQWTENVGYWHHAHSFVRGNWRNSKLSSPMILQKSCHDMDNIQWLVGAQCEEVSSFGELSYFKEENAPEGSTARCTDGCNVEHECPYSALKWYYNENDEWPQNVVSLEPKLEVRLKALQEGPYGRCVFHCDNDVVDHQVVNLKFAGGITVSFTMSSFTTENTRTVKLMGTEGEIRGHHKNNEIEINYFSGKRETVRPLQVEGGHEGADTLIMRDFIRQVNLGDIVGKTPAIVSAQSHLIAFAAEQSRVTGQTVRMSEYIASLKAKS